MNTLRDAALKYAKSGKFIIPLHSIKTGQCSCGKNECKQGKHPRTQHGLKDASTDPKVIEAWWTKWPDANIGLLTGKINDLVIVDVDVSPKKDGSRKKGEESLKALEAQYGALPETLISITGSGGHHLAFKYPSGIEKLGNRTAFREDLDIRADGGYIVVAPSTHISGGTYTWQNDLELAELPDWLLGIILDKSKPQQQSLLPKENRKKEPLAGVPEGCRNDAVFKLACSLRERGLSFNEARERVFTMASHCRPPLPESEAIKTVEGVYRRYPAGSLSARIPKYLAFKAKLEALRGSKQ